MKLALIIEKDETGTLWGRIEGIGEFMPVKTGDSVLEIRTGITNLVTEYLQHEGKQDIAWQKAAKGMILNIDVVYDLKSFFTEHSYLKISSIAEKAGLNPGLVGQYASGVKHPSQEQVNKLESAIHDLASNLLKVRII